MFWIREIAGWLLIALALFLIRIAWQFLTDFGNPKIVEAGLLIIASLGVLRAGVLLIRISTAARMCMLERRANQPRKTD